MDADTVLRREWCVDVSGLEAEGSSEGADEENLLTDLGRFSECFFDFSRLLGPPTTLVLGVGVDSGVG